MEKDHTWEEVLAGMLVSGICVQMILLLFLKNRVYHATGLWCGIFCASFCLFHLKCSLAQIVQREEKDAMRYMKKSYIVRLLFVGVVTGFILYFKIGSPITLLIGILILKPAAYIQPSVHLVFQKIHKEGG